MKKLITVFAVMLISAVVLSSPAQALTNVSGSYVLDENGKHVTIPVLFEAKQVISDFKVEGSYNGLNDPKDLYADKNGYYIADTGNNRILVTDKSFKVVRELTEAFHEAVDDYLSYCKEEGIDIISVTDNTESEIAVASSVSIIGNASLRGVTNSLLSTIALIDIIAIAAAAESHKRSPETEERYRRMLEFSEDNSLTT